MFPSLEKNLKDNVIEAQLKLGYDPTPMRFYYPQDSVEHLAQTGHLTEQELYNKLVDYCQDAKERIGGIGVEVKEERFCFCLEPEVITHFWKEAGDQSFLKELIGAMQNHVSDIDKIRAIFEKYSDHVIFQEMKDEDFNYLLEFEDGKPDDYAYCFQIDGCGAIYHRFTKYDYRKLFVEGA
jgi:hypothetical protein